MLQQTRVEVAVGHYQSFLKAFPSVAALAAASEEEVRARWSGLGYYRRARSLLEAARRIVERGGFPDTLEEWLELPGVGRYTAAAVLSIAFGARVVALDGNLERVLSRITAFEGDPRSASGRRLLEQSGVAWLDGERPGDSNQALMELGATICRPKTPRCPDCPVARSCEAFLQGRQGDFPIRRPRPKPVRHRLLMIMVRRGQTVLLFRREIDALLLGGTYELPWVDADGANPEKALNSRYGGNWRLGKALGTVRHSITHRRLRVEVTEGTWLPEGRIEEGREARWTDRAGLEALPHSSLVRKALAIADGETT